MHVAACAQVQIFAVFNQRQISDAANSIARRMTRAFITGLPSSEIATMPAFFIEAMDASSSPALSFVIAPIGIHIHGRFLPRPFQNVVVTVGLSLRAAYSACSKWR